MRSKITCKEISRAEVSDKAREKCVVYTTTDSKTCTLRVYEDLDNPKNVCRLSLRDYTFDSEGTTVDMKFIKTKMGVKFSDVTHGGNCLEVRNEPGYFTISYGVDGVRVGMLNFAKHKVGENESAFHSITHAYLCPSSSKYSVVRMMVWYDNRVKGRLKFKISTGPSWVSGISEVYEVMKKDFRKCKLQVKTSSSSSDDGHQKAITSGIDVIKNQGTFNGELNGSILKIFDNVINLNLTK